MEGIQSAVPAEKSLVSVFGGQFIFFGKFQLFHKPFFDFFIPGQTVKVRKPQQKTPQGTGALDIGIVNGTADVIVDDFINHIPALQIPCQQIVVQNALRPGVGKVVPDTA